MDRGEDEKDRNFPRVVDQEWLGFEKSISICLDLFGTL